MEKDCGLCISSICELLQWGYRDKGEGLELESSVPSMVPPFEILGDLREGLVFLVCCMVCLLKY